MKLFDIIFNKVFQFVISIIQKFLQIPQQLTFCGAGSTEQLCAHVLRVGYRKILLVTDKPLVNLGLAGRVVDYMQSRGADIVIYDGVTPDPTTAVVQGALDLYRQQGCDAIMAMGGGSSIDTAKTAAAAASNVEIADVMGLFKIKKAAAPLFAIPTTAGTGSESWGAVMEPLMALLTPSLCLMFSI